MNLRAKQTNSSEHAFTLVEVLAALAFMAIVIPVAIQGLHIATLAGEVAERKAVAARVAERILNENIVTTNWNQSSLKGTVTDGSRDFEWTINNEPWTESPMRLLTVEVNYNAQGKTYSVHLSTIVDGSTEISSPASSSPSSGTTPGTLP